jgi:hypothetical protein
MSPVTPRSSCLCRFWGAQSVNPGRAPNSGSCNRIRTYEKLEIMGRPGGRKSGNGHHGRVRLGVRRVVRDGSLGGCLTGVPLSLGGEIETADLPADALPTPVAGRPRRHGGGALCWARRACRGGQLILEAFPSSDAPDLDEALHVGVPCRYDRR